MVSEAIVGVGLPNPYACFKNLVETLLAFRKPLPKFLKKNGFSENRDF